MNIKKKILINLSYKLDDSLLYSIKYNSRRHLRISDTLIEMIFKMTHDKMRHCRFNRAFEHLHRLAINKTSHQLQVYINECSDCSKNQTHCHKFYSNLQLILSLLIFKENYNIMLIITDKFTKKVQLISEKNI